MSNIVSSWVWHCCEAGGNDRLVLLALADEADDDGGGCYPSVDLVAAKCRVNRATVLRAIERLEADDEVVVVRPDKKGRGHFNRYTLVLGRDLSGHDLTTSKGRRLPPFTVTRLSVEKRREKVAEWSRKGAPRRDLTPDPGPLPPNSEEHSSPPAPDNVVIVFEAWLEATGRSARSVLDAKRRALITKALADYPLEDVLDAVRGWKHSSFHRGDEGKVWNDLGLLLRDADHIEQFRDLARKPPETRRRSPGSPPPVDPDRNIDKDRSGESRRLTDAELWPGEPEAAADQSSVSDYEFLYGKPEPEAVQS